MTTYKRRRNGKYKPDWDRGDGWMRTKAEWQDFDKAVDKTVDLVELKEMWTPASGSTITINHPSIEGISFDLLVEPKEYHAGTGRKRKPTKYGITLSRDGVSSYLPFIPHPGSTPSHAHQGAWHHKQSWSAAVKELIHNIIPLYDAHREAMQLWSMVQQQDQQQVPEVPELGQDKAPAA